MCTIMITTEIIIDVDSFNMFTPMATISHPILQTFNRNN